MDELPKARQVLVVSTGPLASIRFGFWSFLGAMGAFGLGLQAIRVVRWAEAALRTWLGL